MKNIKPILKGIYENLELRRTCVPLFLGNPGLGKSHIIRQYAESVGANLVPVIASTKMPHEISGMAMPLNDEKRMTYFDYDLFANLKDGDIIFFDELLNANPMILNACLTVLEDRVLPSGRVLPDIMIVAAANPQGATVLTPQIKERFIWYDVKFDREMWEKDYIEGIENWIIPDNILNPLCQLIGSESFSSEGKNYYTPRSISKCIKMSINGIKSPLSQVVNILNTFIENTSGGTIKIGDYDMLMNEKLPWLKIQKLLINDKVIKQQESTITDGIFS